MDDRYKICLTDDLDLCDLEYQFLTDATPGSIDNFRLSQEELLSK